MKNNPITKRILSVLVALVLVLPGFAVSGATPVHAATPRSGEHSSDEGATTWKWSLDTSGKLTIEPKIEGGTAYIAYKDGAFPWGNNAEDKELRDAIQSETTSIEIKEGMAGKVALTLLFNKFTNLRSADLTKLNTSEVTSTYNMFQSCEKLEEVDTTGWDFSRVTTADGMFKGCKMLTAVKGIENWNTSSLDNMYYMFYGCESLPSLNLNSWRVTKLTHVGYAFANCAKLETLEISNWKTGSIRYFTHTFMGCSSLKSLDLSGFDSSGTTSLYMTFYGCKSLNSITFGDTWDTSNVTDMSSMFTLCNALTDFSFMKTWDVSSVTKTSGMFHNCKGMTELCFGKNSSGAIEASDSMFANCSNLETLDLRFFNGYVSLKDAAALKDLQVGGGFKGGQSPKNMVNISVNPLDPSPYIQKNNSFPQGAGHYVPAKQISFEKKDGEGSMDPLYLAEGVDNVPLRENTFTKNKAIFAGWNTKYNGSGTAFQDKDIVSYANAAFQDGYGSYTLYAQWDADENEDGFADKNQKFTIIYKDTDGSVIETVGNLGVGDTVAAYTPPKPTGKVFSAWTPDFQTTVKAENAETGTTNIIYTATWKEDRNNDGTADEDQYITVTYKDGAEGAAFADVVITEVNGVKLIPGDATPAYPNGTPEREFYVFDAWTPSLADVLGNSDATYTATWKDDKNKDNVPDEDQPFTVTFNGNGKAFATNKPADQSIVYGNKATRPTATPTAEKAIFDNWYKDQACSEAFNFETEEITAGTTIWAGWFDDLNEDDTPDKDEDTYYLIYKYENAPPEGAWAPPLLPPSLWNMEITISGSPAPVAGYIFKGWRVTSPADLVVENGKFMMPKSNVTITGPWVKKNFNDNIKDEEGNPIKPKDPLPSNPEPQEGDRFLDEKGDPYEITEVGPTDPETGNTPITVKPVPKTYNDVKDEEGNPVTPKPPFDDKVDDNKPEEGKRFLDDKGDPYEITDIGDTDPETGDTPITVKPVPKTYDDIKDDEDNPIKPKEPFGKDGKEPKEGERFEDENGDEYEITDIGDSDPNGKVPIKVKQVMTLSFDLDGGTLAGQTGTFIVKELKNNSFVIPKEAPTKDGYKFLYWEGSVYYPGDTYVVKDHHVFTAKWAKAAETEEEEKDDAKKTASKGSTKTASKLTKASRVGSARTADSSAAELWILLLAASAALLVVAAKKQRRNRT